MERRRNPTDRRARALHLTAKGRRLLDKVMTVSARHEAELCAPLTAPEREHLMGLLRRVAAGQGLVLGVRPGLTGGPVGRPGRLGET